MLRRMMYLALISLGFFVLSCASQPEVVSKPKIGVSLKPKHGVDPKWIEGLFTLLKEVKDQGGGVLSIEKIFSIFPVPIHYRDFVMGKWKQPVEFVCQKNRCESFTTNKEPLEVLITEVDLPAYGNPNIEIAQKVTSKFMFQEDGKTLDICSVTGIKIVGFRGVGAQIYLDGEDSYIKAVAYPSVFYPNDDCDFLEDSSS